jgi:uncharacterized protein YdiU (UPF0061 family)
MDHFNPAQKYSFIDQGGRYAYQNQPGIAQWNLVRLAEALRPLLDPDQDRAVELAKAELEKFPALHESHHLEIFARKLGHPGGIEPSLLQDLFDLMAAQGADFTLTFRGLGRGPDAFLSQFQEGPPAREWLARWQALGPADLPLMNSMNPAFIPRNHRIEEVLEAARNDDFTPFHELHRVLAQPYREQPESEKYERPPRPEEVVCATFCGT